jgi:cytoskeletal protein CcmA (bactofilin family)
MADKDKGRDSSDARGKGQNAGGLSIIAVGMSVNGDIDSDGTVKVEGSVVGQVRATTQVLIARGGEVRGDISAREVIVGGSVVGTISATERIEVQPGAAIEGDVLTRRIAVAEGAKLDGQVRMSDRGGEAGSAVPAQTAHGHSPSE